LRPYVAEIAIGDAAAGRWPRAVVGFRAALSKLAAAKAGGGGRVSEKLRIALAR
jgi:hypothetical protein